MNADGVEIPRGWRQNLHDDARGCGFHRVRICQANNSATVDGRGAASVMVPLRGERNARSS
jgi:hypothetical protein